MARTQDYADMVQSMGSPFACRDAQHQMRPMVGDPEAFAHIDVWACVCGKQTYYRRACKECGTEKWSDRC